MIRKPDIQTDGPPVQNRIVYECQHTVTMAHGSASSQKRFFLSALIYHYHSIKCKVPVGPRYGHGMPLSSRDGAVIVVFLPGRCFSEKIAFTSRFICKASCYENLKNHTSTNIIYCSLSSVHKINIAAAKAICSVDG